MKKILLSACLLATTAFAFAQKPAEGDHSLTFGISGINTIGVSTPTPTGSLLFKHYLKNGLAARVGIFLGTNSSTQNGSAGGDSIKVSSMSWAVQLGIQRAFKGTARLETYVGADLLVGGSSKTTTTTFSSTSSMEDKKGATMNFGIVPCTGLNYYIADWLALGAEFGWGFISSSTAEGTTTFTTGGTSTTVKSPKSSSAGFQNWSHGMVTVTAAFH